MTMGKQISGVDLAGRLKLTCVGATGDVAVQCL